MRPRHAVLPLALLAIAALTVPPAAASGSAPGPASPTPTASASSTDWPMYHGNLTHGGWTSSMPLVKGPLRTLAVRNLDGEVYGSPIVATGRTFVATENDTVYAFGPHLRRVWSTHLASPATSADHPCGDIDPLGVTGTPIYWAGSGLLYVAAEITGAPPTHRLFALDPATGKVVFSRSLDFSGVDQSVMQQRGALTAADGRVWVPFGGLAGDCGNYKGRMVGIPLEGKGGAVVYTVPTQREGGIWTPPGATVDPSTGRLFVAVGNGAAGTNGLPYDFTDAVLALNGNGKVVESFSPKRWRHDNALDLDLGSQGPALVGKWVFQAGKSGIGYVLDRAHLGGIGGQVSRRTLCNGKSYAGTAVREHVVYVPCQDGVRAVRIGPAGRMQVLWQASVSGSPVVGGGRVWVIDTSSGTLYALGLVHGTVRESISLGSVDHFVTPALSGRRVLVGTTAGLRVITY